MARGDDITFEGFENMIVQLRRFGVDVTKRSEQLKIYKRNAKPYQKALRGGGIIKDAERSIKYFRNPSIVYDPGNARKSIKMFANKRGKKDNTFVFVGPQAKKPEKSGYYLWFHLPDAGGNIKKKNDWKRKAFAKSMAEMERGVSKDLTAYMTKVGKQRGFEV